MDDPGVLARVLVVYLLLPVSPQCAHSHDDYGHFFIDLILVRFYQYTDERRFFYCNCT